MALGINIGTNDPDLVFMVPALDLTGSEVNLLLSWPGGSDNVSSEDGDLVIAEDGGSSTVTWVRTVQDSRTYKAPLIYDLYRTIDGGTSKLGAGQIALAGSGQIISGASISVQSTGPQGPRGWTAELAVVEDGSRRVQQVADWFGGVSDKPAVGQYVGADGFVDDIEDAVDIGGPANQDTLDARDEAVAAAETAVAATHAAVPLFTTQTAAFTFNAATQNQRLIPVNVASQIDVTLPNPTGLNLGEGASLLQVGAGRIRFIDHSAAALTGANVLGYARTYGAKAVVSFLVVPNAAGTNSWLLSGDLAA